MLIAALVLAQANWNPPMATPLATKSLTGIELKRPGMRDLSLRATFPTKGGPYPVIVLSHGMYGSEDGLLPLSSFWAEQGYVVLQPTHDDSLRYADAETRRAAMSGSLDNTGSWGQRPKDVRLVLDSLDTITKRLGPNPPSMNMNLIGMAGHSFGAWTTQVVAGMKLGPLTGLADPRPKAFISVAPSGTRNEQPGNPFEAMRGPMLFISGDNDSTGVRGDVSKFRKEAYLRSPAGGKLLMWIAEADHSFGGINGRARAKSNPKHVEQIQKTTLAFWDSTLKGSKAAKTWLDDRTIETSGGVKLSSR